MLRARSVLKIVQIEREEKAQQDPETTITTTDVVANGANQRPNASRSRSHRRMVSDLGQTNEVEPTDENTMAEELQRRSADAAADGVSTNNLSPTFKPQPRSPETLSPVGSDGAQDPLVLPGTNITLDSPNATQHGRRLTASRSLSSLAAALRRRVRTRAR